MASVGAPLPRLQRQQAGVIQRQRAGVRSRARAVLGVLCAAGGLLLMVVQVPFFVSIALTAPLTARVGLGLLWLVQFTLGVHWRASRPLLPLLLAAAMAASWYLLGVVAAPHLGWTLAPLG